MKSSMNRVSHCQPRNSPTNGCWAVNARLRQQWATRAKGAGGPERWSLVKSRPVYDEQGAVLYVITIVQDVTERVQVEQRKDAFISLASHELKTPVTSLKGFTAVLQRRLSKQGDG